MFITPQSDLSELKAYPRLLETWKWFSGLHEKLGHLPSRLDIDPLDIRFCLGYEMLTENYREENNCRFRLVGLVIEEFTGLSGSVTGLWYDKVLDAESTRRACETISSVIDKGQPLFGTTSYDRKDGTNWGNARLICPLKRLQGEAEMVFIVFQGFHEDTCYEKGAIKEQAVRRWLHLGSAG